MNPTELKTIVDTLTGIADGKPWQSGDDNNGWHDCSTGELMSALRLVIGGIRIRLKPWELTPEQIADGWIPWNGGECPVEPESVPEYMMADGQISKATAGELRWDRAGDWGNIIAYKPDPYGKFRQALADGKVIQCKDSYYKWVDLESPVFDSPPDQYRIKPEPQWLPIGPEDVPPFSLIRRKGQTDEYGKPQYWHWRLISYVTGIGPVCADRGYNWQELSTDYEINRPRHRDADGNPTLWEPCHKLSTV